MNDAQTWTVIGVVSAVLFSMLGVVSTLFVRILRAEIGGLRGEMNARFDAVNSKFDVVHSRIDAMSARIDGLDRDVQALVKRTFGLDRE